MVQYARPASLLVLSQRVPFLSTLHHRSPLERRLQLASPYPVGHASCPRENKAVDACPTTAAKTTIRSPADEKLRLGNIFRFWLAKGRLELSAAKQKQFFYSHTTAI